MNLAQLINPNHGKMRQPADENGEDWYWVPFISAAPERTPLYRPTHDEFWIRLNTPVVMDRGLDDIDEPV